MTIREIKNAIDVALACSDYLEAERLLNFYSKAIQSLIAELGRYESSIETLRVICNEND